MLKIAITNRTNIKENYIYSRVNIEYMNAVLKSGAFPFMLPNADKNALEEMMKEMDGLIITGGDDINPSFYNKANTYSEPNVIEDDINDLNLIEICLKLNKPILGICRGLQIINVYFNGSLYQDIVKEGLTNISHNQKEKEKDYIYYANFDKNSILYDIFNAKYYINSFHHQAIEKLGNNLKIAAKSDDNVIEAIEWDKKILAVQWHPEKLIDDEKHLNIFKKFNELCLNSKSR